MTEPVVLTDQDQGRQHRWPAFTIAIAGAMLAVGFFLLAIGYIGQHNQLREQDTILTKDSSILARPSLVLGYDVCYNNRQTAWIDAAVASTQAPNPNPSVQPADRPAKQLAHDLALKKEEKARRYLDDANNLTSPNVCKDLLTAKKQAERAEQAGK